MPVQVSDNPDKFVYTDGFDTLGKVAGYSGVLFVIYGVHDSLMPSTFAIRLLQARYLKSDIFKFKPPVHIELDGDHNDLMFFDDDEALMVYKWHLQIRVLDLPLNQISATAIPRDVARAAGLYPKPYILEPAIDH